MANSRQTEPTRPSLPLIGLKRTREDFEMPSLPGMSRYNVHGDDFGRHHLHAAYVQIPDTLQGDRGLYVNMQHVSSYHSREDYWRGQHVNALYNQDHLSVSSFVAVGVGSVKLRAQLQVTLPRADQSSTLFVEGLSAECTREEVSRILFLVYSQRSITYISTIYWVQRHKAHQERATTARWSNVDPLLCRIFLSRYAAAAMDTLQRYKFDLYESNSAYLKLQFYRNVEGNLGSGHRANR